MSKGRKNQLTKQIGEYLVAAELGRRGFLATTFTGNVPHYDVLATDAAGGTLAIQVKAINRGSWQFDIRQFADVKLQGKRQVIGDTTAIPHPNLICVFVVVDHYGSDRFFVFEWRDLQAVLVERHRQYLDERGGIRPRRYDSFHTAVGPQHLVQFEGNWALIERRLSGRE